MLTWPKVTHAAGRYLGGITDQQWAEKQVAPFPMSWAGRLLERWSQRHAIDRRESSLDLLARCTGLAQAHRAGLPADANDSQICQAATDAARDMSRRLAIRDTITDNTLTPTPSPWFVGYADRMRLVGRYLEALHWLKLKGIEPARWRGAITPFLRRVQCPRWWRRVLRVVHARAVEGTARTLGLVSKATGCYVSDDGLRRRAGQVARNEAALKATRALNEHGQDYTLAELAAKGPANRAIRRHELMTRIAGFETIAKECGHEAAFITLTCPSRMHAVRTKRSGFGVEPNPSFDGTAPDAAQRHLSSCWARFRAAADRHGLALYGFRIAEPNHDGTPHWHCLLFYPSELERGRHAGRLVGSRVLIALLRRYFFRQVDTEQVDRKERQWRRRRSVHVEMIDWKRGTAAGYVAKYVSKNIDGYGIQQDLLGNDAITASQRVEAWASTWRIRQFQQIGGAPVGIWRELRRVHVEQAQAAPVVEAMVEAVNIKPDRAGDINAQWSAAHGWATYLHMQGGHRVARRSLRLKLLREQSGELGRYGDVVAPKPVGVLTVDQRREVTKPFGIVLKPIVQRREVLVEIESERCAWQIVPEHGVRLARERLQATKGRAEGAAPWSPVNNCTAPPALFGPKVERWAKRGRWVNWNGGVHKETHHAEPEGNCSRSP